MPHNNLNVVVLIVPQVLVKTASYGSCLALALAIVSCFILLAFSHISGSSRSLILVGPF